MVLIHECLYSDLLREDYYEGHRSSGAPQVIPWHFSSVQFSRSVVSDPLTQLNWAEMSGNHLRGPRRPVTLRRPGAPQVIPWHLGTSLKVPRHVPRYYFSSFDSATTLEVRRPGPISFLQMQKLSITRSYKVDFLTTEAEFFPSLFLLGSYLLTLLGRGQNYMV